MTYDKNYITAIILKNEHDSCSKEELEMLEEWYKRLNDETQAQKLNNSNADLKKNKIWESITAQIDSIEHQEAKIVELKASKSAFYYIARIAAILIVLAGSYVAFKLYNNRSIDTPIDNTEYLSQVNNTEKPQKIILADNSLLWLDAKSSIKYAKYFTSSRSMSLLAGKVFLNVAHDSSKPFVVATGDGLKTTVLGTAFVIEKGAASNQVKVGVLRGRVQVSDNVSKYATLCRNQAVSVNTDSKSATLSATDSLEMTGWFTSKIVLDNVTLKVVANSIQKNFGYTIKFSSPKLLTKRCSITYNATDNVEDILYLLDKIYHTSHIISGKIIHVKSSRD